jgi:hypothetical protein
MDRMTRAEAIERIAAAGIYPARRPKPSFRNEERSTEGVLWVVPVALFRTRNTKHGGTLKAATPIRDARAPTARSCSAGTLQRAT